MLYPTFCRSYKKRIWEVGERESTWKLLIQKVGKILLAIDSALVVWMTSCAYPLLEREEEKAGRRSSPHFHQY